jgi:hypothetical protein
LLVREEHDPELTDNQIEGGFRKGKLHGISLPPEDTLHAGPRFAALNHLLV